MTSESTADDDLAALADFESIWGVTDRREEREPAAGHPCGVDGLDGAVEVGDDGGMGNHIRVAVLVVCVGGCISERTPIPPAHGGERSDIATWQDVTCFDRRGVAMCAQSVAWCEAARMRGDGVCKNFRRDGLPHAIDLAAQVRVIDSGPGPRARPRPADVATEDVEAKPEPSDIVANDGIARYCVPIRVRGYNVFICETTLELCEEGHQRARLSRGVGVVGSTWDCYDAGDEPPTLTFDWRTLREPTAEAIEADRLERTPIGDADYEPGKGCRRGCACGRSCIECSKQCNVGRPPPTVSPGAITCKKGCRCGNACISCAKTCRR